MRTEFACLLSAKPLNGVEGDFEASQPEERVRTRSAERQKHPRPASDHVPCDCPGRQELRPHCGRDRLSEILN